MDLSQFGIIEAETKVIPQKREAFDPSLFGITSGSVQSIPVKGTRIEPVKIRGDYIILMSDQEVPCPVCRQQTHYVFKFKGDPIGCIECQPTWIRIKWARRSER